MNKILKGDCLIELKTLEDNSIDSIVTDPPYELGFMGKSWDNTGIANNPKMWAGCLRVLKPGGHLLAFSGTRTYHRMASAIEDAGFEVRDMIEWIYSTGFPKSHNVFKQLKKSCTCGNMEEYEKRTKTLPEHDLRPMPETDLPQEVHFDTEQGKVLFTGVSEQSIHGTMLRKESEEGGGGGKERILEGRDNNEKTEGELQGSNLSEMSKRVSNNGEERRIHNATQASYGSTLEQITNENGSGASHRPQSEQQQDREPCAFCKQWGTQATRTLGIGTALKPAHEPICMARKPLAEKTVAENCLKYGTGGINIDESRVAHQSEADRLSATPQGKVKRNNFRPGEAVEGTETNRPDTNLGRFPANLIHDNSEEVRECFPEVKSATSRTDTISKGMFAGGLAGTVYKDNETNASRFFKSIPIEEQDEIQEECTSMEEKLEKLGLENKKSNLNPEDELFLDNLIADAKRKEWKDIYKNKSIIYQAKASKGERNSGLDVIEDNNKRPQGEAFGNGSAITEHSERKGNFHPTVKPIALMEYLIKMVTPKGGIVLDPFAGSGSTLVAAKKNGYQYIGIEMTEEYIPIIEARLNSIK